MYKQGEKYQNKKGLYFTIVKMVEGSPKYRYLVRFEATGSEKIVDRGQIKNGAIFDDFDPHIYGIAYKGDIKCVSKLEKKAFSNWTGMISRCYNTRDVNYKSYGGKGVTVDKRWHCFKNFYEDLPLIEGFEEEAYMLGKLHLDKEYYSLDNTTYSIDGCGFISATNNRKKQPSKQKKIVATKGTTTVEFTNINDFCEKHNLRSGSVKKSIANHTTYKGWRFKEKTEIIVFISKATEWDLALDMARLTVNKDRIFKIPSDVFKKKILLSEHSPIRAVQYIIEIKNIPSWVSQHIARHDAFAYHSVRDSNGDVHFVGTARSDRTGISRDDLPQDTPVNHTIYCNANDLINISTKRLCSCASKETRLVWQSVKDAIAQIDEPMADAMVPTCIYRGFCPEFDRCCGYVNTEAYQKRLEDYRKIE